MKSTMTAGLLSLTLVLGACSHYSDDMASLEKNFKTPNTVLASASPQTIEPAAGGPIAGETLNSALAREYYDMAKSENDQAYDYKAAKEYTKKAMLAAQGVATPPARVSSYNIPANKIAELAQARRDLVTALKQPTTDNQAQLAKAQVAFDCWLERAEEAATDSHYATCKEDFEQAMAMMIMPAAGETTTAFDIPFSAETTVIPPDSVKTIDYVAQFLDKPENAGYMVSIIGYPYDVLANTKTNAVRMALIEKGIAEKRLNGMATTGETLAPGSVRISLVPPMTGAPGSSVTKTYVPIQPMMVPPSTTVVPVAPVKAPATSKQNQ